MTAMEKTPYNLASSKWNENNFNVEHKNQNHENFKI